MADLTAWLGELVRQVDSSLLEEWERLRNPEPTDAGQVGAALDDRTPPVTSNLRAFRVLVRNAMFRRVELAARRQWFDLGELDRESGWTADDWAGGARRRTSSEHPAIQTGANARGPQMLIIDERAAAGLDVRQILDDPAGDHDWAITAEVDLDRSDALGEAAITITGMAAL